MYGGEQVLETQRQKRGGREKGVRRREMEGGGGRKEGDGGRGKGEIAKQIVHLELTRGRIKEQRETN